MAAMKLSDLQVLETIGRDLFRRSPGDQQTSLTSELMGHP
jgi:hypothetical protein